MPTIHDDKSALYNAANAVTGFVGMCAIVASEAQADIEAAARFNQTNYCAIGPASVPFPSIDPGIEIQIFVYTWSTQQDALDIDDTIDLLVAAFLSAGADNVTRDVPDQLANLYTSQKLKYTLKAYYTA